MKLRRLTIFLLILILQFSSGTGVVFAQVATDSASPTLPAGNVPAVELDVPANSSSISSIESSKFSLDNNEPSVNSSATLGKIFVKNLSKRNFQYKDKISFDVYNTLSSGFKVRVLNARGKETNLKLYEKDFTDKIQITINPTGNFTPGKYTVEVIQNGQIVSTQDFTWGVLAINTNKSIYAPNETANLAIAVLDENGELVCDAKVSLFITDPNSNQIELSTENGKINVNSVCGQKIFTLTPDYEASFQVGSLTGQYSLTLTAETKNGKYSVTDSFQVEESTMFDVERVSATRIYPPLTYPVELKVKANQDFNGQITEVVPDSFQITFSTDSAVLKPDSIKTVSTSSTIASASAQGPSVLGAQALSMPFSGTPNITLGFGESLDLIDPAEKGLYQSFSLLGHDGIDFAMPEGTPVVSVDDGTVILASEKGDYGWTMVVQHSWGRSYYGHLSEFVAKLDQKVLKGEKIALSGMSGRATGPHLHFGVKPNNPDMSNGYYGKVDPAPLLGLPTDGRVLGASVQNQEEPKSKVLTWNISVKKGDIFTLGYRFKAPPQSPQFYSIGPASFFDSNQNVIFQEQRQWQIASDAISIQSNWAQQYASATYPSGAVNANYTISAGTNRLLVVAIASSRTAAGTQTLSSITYGGQALTLAAGDAANTANWNHSYLYYLDDAGIAAASGTSLNVTITGGTSYYTFIYAAVFAGVDQTTPYTDAQNYNNAAANSAVGPFASGLTVAEGDQAIEIVNLARSSAGTTARTISTWSNSTWPDPSTVAATYIAVSGPTVGLHINNRNVTTAATETSQHTAGSTNTFDSMTGMSIKASTSLASSGTIMSPEIDYDWVSGATTWGTAAFSTTETNGDVKLKVYYTASAACDTIVPDGVLSGNSSGFDVSVSPVNISGLTPVVTTYNKICLQASLTDSGGTPYLNDWTVTWLTGPTNDQLMRHGKWFSSGAEQPFTF